MTRGFGVWEGQLGCVSLLQYYGMSCLWNTIMVTSALVLDCVSAGKSGKWFKLGYYLLPKRHGSIDRSPTGRFRSSISSGAVVGTSLALLADPQRHSLPN